MTTAIAVVVDASILLALALVLCRVLRRRSAALRHMILAGALAAAAVVPLLEASLPHWEFDVLSSTSDVINSGPTLGSAPSVGADALAIEVAPAPQFTWSARAAVIWAIGFVAVMAGFLGGIARLLWLTRRCQPVRSNVWRQRAAALSREYALTRPVAVLESGDRALVLTWGLWRPRIIVPAGAASWAVERVDVVLAHELAHIARRDWALQIAAETVCALYWFNPLIWLACRRLRDESEQACDDAVLHRGVNASDYASHLLAVARELVGTGRGWASAPAVANPSTLEKRIAAMLNASRNRKPLTRAAGVTTIVAALALTAPVAAVTLTARVEPTPIVAGPGVDVRLVAPAPEPRPAVAPATVVRRTTRRAAAAQAPAQQPPASVSGTLRDASGAVLPGVELTLTQVASPTRYSAFSDAGGRFAFRNVPPGRYELVASLPGFAALRIDLTLAAGQDVQRDLMMRIGSVMESIKVVCGAAVAALPSGGSDNTVLAYDRRAATTRLFTMPHATPGTPPMLAAQGVPIRVGGQIAAPRKVKDVAPICPGAALPGGGLVVILEATIGVDGMVGDIRSLRPPPSEPPSEFVKAALEAVRQWQFTPTRLNNVPVPVIMTVTVSFSRP